MTDAVIAKQAAEWFISNQEGGLTLAHRTSFLAWLKASPVHVREYLAIASVAQEFVTAVEKSEYELDELCTEAANEDNETVVSLYEGVNNYLPDDNVKPGKVNERRSRWGWAIAASVVICAATVIAVLQQNLSWFKGYEVYRTAHAEQRTWTLSDGSVMHLNSDSAVKVSFSSAQRRIDLEYGQAYFQVFKDSKREFLVKSGKTEAVAIGTEFDVYHKNSATTITVAEGRVAVLPGLDSATKNHAAIPEREFLRLEDPLKTVELDAGSALKIYQRDGVVEQKKVDLRQATAWLKRQIIFDRQPLGEVAQEFNRYSRVKIEIEDSGLRAMRVSGVFNAYDTESFVGFLDRLDGVFVEKKYNQVKVRSKVIKVENQK
ncbi:MAG: FecR domain-containing protein [Porticoccaceae bacterium]|nr:FecR domain-containing protein [Porticoccaceae bacterium]